MTMPAPDLTEFWPVGAPRRSPRAGRVVLALSLLGWWLLGLAAVHMLGAS